MADVELLEPTRENVFSECERLFARDGKPPTRQALSTGFNTPKSPRILVYLSEWRSENLHLFGNSEKSVRHWKLEAEKAIGALELAKREVSRLNLELYQFRRFANERYPHLIDEFESLSKTSEV